MLIDSTSKSSLWTHSSHPGRIKQQVNETRFSFDGWIVGISRLHQVLVRAFLIKEKLPNSKSRSLWSSCSFLLWLWSSTPLSQERVQDKSSIARGIDSLKLQVKIFFLLWHDCAFLSLVLQCSCSNWVGHYCKGPRIGDIPKNLNFRKTTSILFLTDDPFIKNGSIWVKIQALEMLRICPDLCLNLSVVKTRSFLRSSQNAILD